MTGIRTFSHAHTGVGAAFRVFSSEVDTTSREENTSKQKERVFLRFNDKRKDSNLGILSLAIGCWLAASPAAAQTAASPEAMPITLPLPTEGSSLDAPRTLPDSLRSAPAATRALTLTAAFPDEAGMIRSGLVWRVYARGQDGRLTLVAESREATPHMPLPEGNYIVHVSYGFASAIQRIALGSDTDLQMKVDAGAIRITGTIGPMPIPDSALTFSVFLPEQNNPEGRLVVSNVRSGEIVRLPIGEYHVVSSYGHSNAMSSSELTVETGKVTDATLMHRAATVTLKLVAAPGGDPFAGTGFSVLTPGGDAIHEETGSFPTLVLAEGEYMLIARHEGQVYTREFRVESGVDTDIEVIAR